MRWLLLIVGCVCLVPSLSDAAPSQQTPHLSFLQVAQPRLQGWWRKPDILLSRQTPQTTRKGASSKVALGTLRQPFFGNAAGTFFLALALPTMLIGDLISLVGCSVALGKGDPDTMWGWGLAGIIVTSAGHLLAQSLAIAADTGSSRPLYAGILLSLAINMPFLGYSVFTMIMGVNPRAAGYFGIVVGALTTLGPILLTAPSLGPAAIMLLSSSFVGVATLALGFAALSNWGLVRSRKFRQSFAILPWAAPTQDGGFASGVAFSGQF